MAKHYYGNTPTEEIIDDKQYWRVLTKEPATKQEHACGDTPKDFPKSKYYKPDKLGPISCVGRGDIDLYIILEKKPLFAVGTPLPELVRVLHICEERKGLCNAAGRGEKWLSTMESQQIKVGNWFFITPEGSIYSAEIAQEDNRYVGKPIDLVAVVSPDVYLNPGVLVNPCGTECSLDIH